MDLLKEIQKLDLPGLNMNNNINDPMLRARLFYPDFMWSWYPVEFDGKDLFFGLVDGDFPELGYFTLSELMGNRGKLGLPVELDLSYRPIRLSEMYSHL